MFVTKASGLPSEVNIDSAHVTALVGGTFGSPTVIERGSKVRTVVLVFAASDGHGGFFELDAGFTVGDQVEIYSMDASYPAVKDESGVWLNWAKMVKTDGGSPPGPIWNQVT